MINIFIFIISCAIAFLLKSLDIKLKFKESNIHLSILDSFKILFIITKSFIQISFDTDTSKKSKKRIKRLYFLHFNYLLVFLTSIVCHTLKEFNKDRDPSIDNSTIKRKNNEKILDMLAVVKESMPLIWNPSFA